ncbi:hypothetical protein BG003_007282 [Podila horticola]|nr:hypothetical protein BG003_007282 [Podila horticola]
MTTIHEIILATLMILSWHYSTVLAVGNSQDILSTGALDLKSFVHDDSKSDTMFGSSGICDIQALVPILSAQDDSKN